MWKVIALVEFVVILMLLVYLFYPFRRYTMEDALKDEIKARQFEMRVKEAVKELRRDPKPPTQVDN